MIFKETEVMLIRGWDPPEALAKSDGYWESFTPEFRLVAPYRRAAAKKKPGPAPIEAKQMSFNLFESACPPPAPQRKPIPLHAQRKRAFDAFRFSLPKEVATVLQDFRSHQWHLLTLLHYDKQVIDLAKTNPVLAYAVAEWFSDHPSTRRPLGKMKQRELLPLLQLPDTEALVKLFRKIPPESIDQRLFPALLTALRTPDGSGSKLLSHVPVINMGVMELVLTPHVRDAASPSLLGEIAADDREKYRATAAAMIRDILAMRTELGEVQPLRPIPSLARCQEMHAAVSAEFRKLEKMRYDRGELPLPPLPGLPGKIIPLRSQAELLAEGRAQKNCVASYSNRVIAGQCFIYSVRHPSRATLSITRRSDGNWGIGELEASCNRPVDSATREFVKAWLEPHRLGA